MTSIVMILTSIINQNCIPKFKLYVFTEKKTIYNSIAQGHVLFVTIININTIGPYYKIIFKTQNFTVLYL